MASDALREANAFLAPVLEKEQLVSLRNTPFITRLSKSLPSPPTSTDSRSVTRGVLTYALSLLFRIHNEVSNWQSNDPNSTSPWMEGNRDRRTVHALLDLLVLEGIYPSLSLGVGVPIERRARSFALPALGRKLTGKVQEVVEEQEKDTGLLEDVIDGLLGVLLDEVSNMQPADNGGINHPKARKGISGMVHERCLVDIVAGCGELAFKPKPISMGDRPEWKDRFRRLIDGIPTPALLPALLSLLNPQIPSYFRTPIVQTLSYLPVSRPHSVRHILELFLSSASSGTTSAAPSDQLSIEALSKASRLIGSVPSSMDPSEYFAKVCPQLLEELDSKDPGLGRAAGFTIAEILGKRGRGLEGIMEKEIVENIIGGLDPELIVSGSGLAKGSTTPDTPPSSKKTILSSSALLAFEEDPLLDNNNNNNTLPTNTRPLISEIQEELQQPDSPLVSEQNLSKTLHRLELLLSSNPTPIIPQRLLAPVTLPLWGLMGYAKSTNRENWYSRTAGLLKSYITTTATAADTSSSSSSGEKGVLEELQKNLLFTGRGTWEFGSGSEGGIEIRRRSRKHGGLDIALINSRVEEFMHLLSVENGISETVLVDFYLRILREWLNSRNQEDEGKEGEGIVVQKLTMLKILQEMPARVSEALGKNPTQVLQIIKGVLEEFVEYKERIKAMQRESENPSLSGLGKIVSDAPSIAFQAERGGRYVHGLNEGERGEEDEDEDEETQQTQTVSLALGLLNVIISTPSTKLTPSDERLLNTLTPPLSYLTTCRTISPELSSLAFNITSLLSLHTPTASSSDSSSSTPLIQQQKETFKVALSYLTDPLIPVRAHGLYLLRELILARSPVIDVANTMRLLISMLKDGDSYVYLNVVKALSALTERHSKTVTKMLVEAYRDDDNDDEPLGPSRGSLGLDERLRIGEALLGTVQRLGDALVGEVANVVGEGMVAVISRRRRKRNNPPISETPKNISNNTKDEDEDEDEDEEQTTLNHKIIQGWHPKNNTEDIRIRTSALSILGTALETNAPGFTPTVLHDVLETSLSILSLETSPETAILRRAAVICIGCVLKSLVSKDDEDWDRERWRGGLWKLVAPRIGDLKRVLGYVRVTDNDGLVREHAGVVEENLEAVLERRFVGGSGGGAGEVLGDSISGGLRIQELG